MAGVQLTPGWATYLRVSDEDKQTPERSFAMQRQRIEDSLLTPSSVPFSREYTDLLSGTNPNRKDYQQMLSDASAGKFSHIGLYRADRFGRNTVEGLQTITQLISMGIKVRVASSPSLRPEEPDGFFMFLIQMGMAQREVDVLAQRTTDGIEAKLRAGGWPNKAPEGYVNKERQISSNKYERWVEIDPNFSQPLKEAWELLLTGRYTLDQICEELTSNGYTRSTGRPWAWNTPKTGKRVTAGNRLHEIFHKPFYAGWVVSEKFDIKLGEVRGKWEPVVTIEQYERGIEILRKNDNNKSREKRHKYLLRNLLWVKVGGQKYKMHGSTPSGRSKSYSYYITHAKLNGKSVRLKTEIVDGQIPQWINGVVIGASKIPGIRETYLTQINQITRKDREKSLDSLKRRISALQEEEARLGRLFMTGQMSEETYGQLRAEWYEKKLSTQLKLEELEIDLARYLDDLEVALVLMSKISELYLRMGEENRNKLLQIVVKRIIINPDGEIISYELNSPFEYLLSLSGSENGNCEGKSGSEQIRSPLLDKKEPPTDNVERFLAMLRFDSREKLQEFSIENGEIGEI